MVENKIIKVAPQDNVGTVVCASGLTDKDSFADGEMVKQRIPMGHKLALGFIKTGDQIYKYGAPIGWATRDIPRGSWVHSQNMDLCAAPDLDKLPTTQEKQRRHQQPLEGYTFQGYKNKDGSVGTKNMLAIATSVQCVAGFADHLATKISTELLPNFPHVDGVVPINHAYGCGVALNSPLAKIPVRTLQNILKNPNFGNQAMILGLGCEKLRPEKLVDNTNTTVDR